jgi:hypothetical protein
MCRHVTSELMTGVKDPPTPEEMAAHEKRMKRLAAREKESGIIVHVMSRYMGMRIHIHDTKERVKFSLLAELLSRYQGGGLCLPPELEVRTKSHLKTMSEQWPSYPSYPLTSLPVICAMRTRSTNRNG